MKGHVVLRVIAKLLIPTILLFALYVQLHGDYSPGGGFQAGILFAAGIVLYTLIYGLDAAERVFRPAAAHAMCALGALLYLGVGVAAMLLGGNFLDYNYLAENPQAGQHAGIILIELGVGITVAGVSITLFFAFAGRGR
jgi:multicomponent Na+:H+ antiporter subunit B